MIYNKHLRRRGDVPRLLLLVVRAVALLTVFMIAPGPAAAANSTADLLSEQDFLGEVPVVLSATRLQQPLSESPVAITVIDRQMIEASGATEIPDLLRLVPGFLVGYDDGHTSAVSYHMLPEVYSRRMQVLIDGRSVYTPAFGGVHWEDLPITLDDIDRIEVIRGPNAATYGSNAFLGTISIITRHAALDHGTMVHTNQGSNGLNEDFIRHGGRAGNLDYRVSVGYRADDGFPARYDDKQVRLVSGRGDYRLGLYDTLRVELGASRGDLQEDTTFDPTTYPPHIKETSSHFEQIRWQHSVSAAQETSLQFYHNYHNTHDDIVTLPIAPLGGLQVPVSYSYASERYDLELQNIFSPVVSTRIVWGLSARTDKVDSQAYLGGASPRSNRTQRAFGNVEWRHGRALVNLGAMYEHNDLTGTDLSPRLAVNYHLSAHNTVRVSVSRATRIPVLIEDYAYQAVTVTVPGLGSFTDIALAGPGNLSSERITSYELGYIGEYPARGLTLDAKLYYDELDNLIGYDTVRPYPGDSSPIDPGAAVFANYDHARLAGFETGLNYRPSEDTRLVLAYAYTDIAASDRTDQVQFTHSAPLNTLSLLAIRRLSARDTASAAYYYVGKMQAWDTLQRRDPVRRLDVRLAHAFRAGSTRGTAAIVLQNVLGSYQEMKLANTVDSRVYGSLTLNF